MTGQLCDACLGAIRNLDGVVVNHWEGHLSLSHHATFNALKHAHDMGCRPAWEALSEPCQSGLLADESAQRPRAEHYHWHSDGQQPCATTFQLDICESVLFYPISTLNSQVSISVVFTRDVGPRHTHAGLPSFYLVQVAPLRSPPGIYIYS